MRSVSALISHPLALTVDDIPAAVRRGAILVDIRDQRQRQQQGILPGALALDHSVLLARLDPDGSARLAAAEDHDVEWVVVCCDGRVSAAAVAQLRLLGLRRVTDLIGGYRALHIAGLVAVASNTRHFRQQAESLSAL